MGRTDVDVANSGRRLGNTAAPPRLRSLIIPAAGEGAVDPLIALASQVTIEQLYFSACRVHLPRRHEHRESLDVYTKGIHGARRWVAANDVGSGCAVRRTDDDERFWPRSRCRLIRLNFDFQ